MRVILGFMIFLNLGLNGAPPAQTVVEFLDSCYAKSLDCLNLRTLFSLAS